MGKTAVRLLVIGGAVSVAGWLVLLLCVLQVLPASLFVSFLGYGMSFVGLIVGLGGLVHVIGARRRAR